METIQSIFGESGALFIKFALALIIVLALIALVSFAIKKLSGNHFAMGMRGRQPRLQIMEATALDTKRRVVLIRRDNVEHLVMIGGANDVLIENSIIKTNQQMQRRPQHPQQQNASLKTHQTSQTSARGAKPSHNQALPTKTQEETNQNLTPKTITQNLSNNTQENQLDHVTNEINRTTQSEKTKQKFSLKKLASLATLPSVASEATEKLKKTVQNKAVPQENENRVQKETRTQQIIQEENPQATNQKQTTFLGDEKASREEETAFKGQETSQKEDLYQPEPIPEWMRRNLESAESQSDLNKASHEEKASKLIDKLQKENETLSDDASLLYQPRKKNISITDIDKDIKAIENMREAHPTGKAKTLANQQKPHDQNEEKLSSSEFDSSIKEKSIYKILLSEGETETETEENNNFYKKPTSFNEKENLQSSSYNATYEKTKPSNILDDETFQKELETTPKAWPKREIITETNSETEQNNSEQNLKNSNIISISERSSLDEKEKNDAHHKTSLKQEKSSQAEDLENEMEKVLNEISGTHKK